MLPPHCPQSVFCCVVLCSSIQSRKCGCLSEQSILDFGRPSLDICYREPLTDSLFELRDFIVIQRCYNEKQKRIKIFGPRTEYKFALP